MVAWSHHIANIGAVLTGGLLCGALAYAQTPATQAPAATAAGRTPAPLRLVRQHAIGTARHGQSTRPVAQMRRARAVRCMPCQRIAPRAPMAHRNLSSLKILPPFEGGRKPAGVMGIAC
jgi:hypothetical protein